ncbi:ATP-binding protein [Microlunatus sp. GCM10028923]|uniref:ATP-binding protein n=1 Tax=Microlunatus sp. GCM10028923 TaxID=3273400 RepID=UPI003612EFCC
MTVTQPGPSTFGALLRAWRERALLTQEELGERAGLDPRTLRRWESGASRPHGRSLRSVADALGLNDDEAAALAAAARGVPSTDQATARPDRPHQLPPAPSHFVGRGDELESVRAQVAAGRSVIAIEGMAGVGKTALAIQAARLLAPHFPDGELFLDLHGFSERTRPLQPAEALARLMRGLNVPATDLPAEVEECASQFRSLVAERRLLFVFDNAAAAGQITPLLPATPTCQVITTSRHTLTGLDRGATIRLGALSRPEAADLFVQAAESAEAPDSEELYEAVDLCGRLPLALRIAAARLRSRPSWRLADLVPRLRAQRAAVLDRSDDQSLGVSAALDLSYAALDEPVRRAYRLIGLMPGRDLDARAAAALLATGEPAAEVALDSLQDLHLIDEEPAGRYGMHDLTRAHAARHALATESERDRTDALIRLLEHHCAWASAAMDTAHPYTKSRRPEPPYRVQPTWTAGEANGWLDTELPNLLAGARAADEHHLHRHVIDLAGVVHRLLIMRNQIAEADALHGMALRAAEQAGDRAAEARAHRDLGRVRRRLNDYRGAAEQFDRALSLVAQERQPLVEVDAHIELASTVRYGGSSVDHDEHLRRAERIARQVGDELGQLEVQVEIAHTRLNEGDYRSAARHFDQTLGLAQRVGYRAREVTALIGRGRTDAELGQPAAAVDRFRSAVELSRRYGLPVGELAGLVNLGHVTRRSGDPSAARDCYREAFVIARRTGDRNWQYEAQLGTGRAHAAEGDGRSALEHHRQARLLAERAQVRTDLARTEDCLGDAHAVLGDPARAEHHWRAALALLDDLEVDHTDDPETSRETIRNKLVANTH